MKRRILSVILAVCMFSVYVPSEVLAEKGTPPKQTELMSSAEWKCAYSNPSYNEETGTLTAAFSCTDNELQSAIQKGDISFLAASYFNGAVINSAKGTYSDGTVTFNIPKGYSYKMYAWNKDTLMPIADKAEWVYENGLVVSSADNVELPTTSDNLAEATSDAVYDLMYAGALLTELESLDITEVYKNKGKLDEYKQKVDNAMAAYRRVTKSAAVLNAVADKEIENSEAALASLQASNNISLYAASSEAVKWAEQINAIYDSAKAGGKIKELARQLGVDAKRAYAMLTMANNILQGEYSEEEAANADHWVKVYTGIKTGAKVGLYITATIATAGAGGGYVTYLEATGITIGGVDCVVDIGKTASTICVGEDNPGTQRLDKISKVTGTVGYLFGLGTFGTAQVGEKLAFLGDTAELLGGYDKLANIIQNDDTGKLTATMTLVGTPCTELTDTQKELLGLPTEDTEKTIDEFKTEMQEKSSTDDSLKETLIDSGIATEATADSVLEETVDNFMDNATSDSAERSDVRYQYIQALGKQIVSKRLYFDEKGRKICEKRYNVDSDAAIENLGNLISVEDVTYDSDGTAWSYTREYDHKEGYLKTERTEVLYSGSHEWKHLTNTTYDKYGDMTSYSTTTEMMDGNYETETSTYSRNGTVDLYLYSYRVERTGGHGGNSYSQTYKEQYFYPDGTMKRSVVYNLYDEPDLPYRYASEVEFDTSGEAEVARHYDDAPIVWGIVNNGEVFRYYTPYWAAAYGVPMEELGEVGGLYYHYIYQNRTTVAGSYSNEWIKEKEDENGEIIPAHWEQKDRVGYSN